MNFEYCPENSNYVSWTIPVHVLYNWDRSGRPIGKEAKMPYTIDGPISPLFWTIPFEGNMELSDIPKEVISEEMDSVLEKAPRGDCACWGIPFFIGKPTVLIEEPVCIELLPESVSRRQEWIVFLHTSDKRAVGENSHGFYSPMKGNGQLGEHAATYVVQYVDGKEEPLKIRRRHQIGAFQRRWGENCFEAVAHHKPQAVPAHHEQMNPMWGRSQTRASVAHSEHWMYWLWALKNPYPDIPIKAIRFEPVSGTVILAAVSAGNASAHPLRWLSRQKAVLTLSDEFQNKLDSEGRLSQLQLDMGQIISATPQPLYPDGDWENSYNNKLPEIVTGAIIVEYTAHPDAHFHLSNGRTIALKSLVKPEGESTGTAQKRMHVVPPAARRVTLRVVEKGSSTPVAVKLHIHGTAGEYLAPVDRHRIVNPAWFEDYSTDFIHAERHACTYIPGETRVDLPLGRVYVEISKGYEIRPLRKVLIIKGDTELVEIELERVLPWRERGWVTADTHVHFLSPMTALLEGSGEGVNVVNLLASQWGELMTNVGDFDGKTTWGSEEAGGDGEYFVRVGTENRQHVLGHISLLGYNGNIIAPMTTGGPNESALGDPIEILLTEWARQCRKQGGLVIIPHFPDPRAENAASIIGGDVDGIEMTSWGDLYSGINPYSLSDWYRYLNCGYMVPAVGGTDKMSATTAVGAVRTYARTDPSRRFDYQSWMDAVRRGETFVTYGPLLELSVDGKRMGSRIEMGNAGGTVEVTWEVASVTVPMSRVELLVNGEIRESVAVDSKKDAGSWTVKLAESAWLALLVRGHYDDKPEIITAHSSPVMVEVKGTPFFPAADAVTILEQIEGAIAFLDTVGTRADSKAYRRMRLVLTAAHRDIHNRMHTMGHFHEHTPTEDHREHH